LEHKKSAPLHVNFALLTISTSRYTQRKQGEPFTDASADLATRLLIDSGHIAAVREVISDDSVMIRGSLARLVADPRVEAVITLGGTGITRTDVTVETVMPILEKELPGFGELFRRISYDQIGSAAVLSRCTAGVIKGKAVFCIPGSPQAVETALKMLIIPEVCHMLKHVRD